MKAFLSYLILPIPVFMLLLATGLVLLAVKRRRAGKVLLILAVGFFVIISTPFVPEFLASQLEQRYPVMETGSVDTNPPLIMVLGAGHIDREALPASVRLSPVSAKRLSEGIRLYRAFPEAKLITSASRKSREYMSHAEVAARAALELGVDPQDTLMLVTATTTYEEAVAFTQRFGMDTPLILVTSATHMHRAVTLFTGLGVNVIPAPTDYLVDPSPRTKLWDYFPGAGSIELMEKVVHEYVGLVWAKVVL